MNRRNVVWGLLFILSCSIACGQSLVARSAYFGNNPRDTDPYEVGFRFKTGAVPRSIEALGFIDLDNTNPAVAIDGDGLLSSVTVSCWEESTQNLIARTTIPSGSSAILIDGFRYAVIASGPVTLAANTNYVIAFNADAVIDGWLDANKTIALDSYFVGSNSSSTWEVRWGPVGSMPTTSGSWGIGRTYGCVNMITSLPVYETAYNPAPADGTLSAGTLSDTGVDVTLSWNAGRDPADANDPNPDITNHLLYLKADDPDFGVVTPVVIDAQSPPAVRVSWQADDLDFGRTYYWRVDEQLNNGPSVIEGTVWSFTTKTQYLTNHITIDPSEPIQIFEGFGEGTMDQFAPYWYAVYPTANLESYLDQLYTLDDKGLGFKICRVLMPVGDAPGHAHHSRMSLIGNVAPKSFEPEENVFDWTGHEGILWRHQGAAQRGAVMWANWYSMPYWLTLSGCTSGASNGLQNLISGKEARFAEHACDVLDHYKNNWGIDFDYVSLLNECEATWWVEYGGQPGCYVSSSQAITLIQELNNCLGSHGHQAKQIAYDAAYTNVWGYLDDLLNSPIEPFLDVLSCHQYSISTSGMNAWKIRAQAYNKRLWQTEWGDWSNAGYPNNRPHQQALNHAAKITQALNDLSCTGWVLWEPDFIFDVDAAGFHPREAYWVTAQYSRHIRPGMQRILSGDDQSSCKTTTWIDNANQQVVLVSYNSGPDATKIVYDFSPYGVVRIKEIRQTSDINDYKYIPFVQTAGDTFNLIVPGESVTTLVAERIGCGAFKQADYNSDCTVDLLDLVKQTEQWLTLLPCEQIECDLNGDCTVNLLDFERLAGQWD